MKYLRVMAKRGSQLVEFDGDWTPEWKKATDWQIQMRVNRFGAMAFGTETERRIHDALRNQMSRMITVNPESELFKEHGWITIATYSDFRMGRENETRGVQLIMAFHRNNVREIASVYQFDQFNYERLFAGIFQHKEDICFNIERGAVQEFRGCTFSNCHIHGQLFRTSMYACNLEDSSFENAMWRKYDDRSVQMYFCGLLGCKYLTNTGLNDISHNALLHGLTYDYVNTSTISGLSDIITNAAFMSTKGKKQVVEKKILDVDGFTGKPQYLTVPPYVPTPGDDLEQYRKSKHHDNPKYKSHFYTWHMTHKLGVCTLTGVIGRFDSEIYSQYFEREAIREWVNMPDEAFVSADRSPYGITHRNACRLFCTEQPVRLHNALRNQFFSCARTHAYCRVADMGSDGRHNMHVIFVNQNRVHNYSYRPPPAWLLGKGEMNSDSLLKFGFELEVELDKDAAKKKLRLTSDQKSQIDNCEEAYFNDVVEEICADGGMYCKHDGSLHYGFELVTHPFSWKWWQENRDTKIQETLEKLRKNCFISHDSGRCGLHVHMSKKAFAKAKLYAPDGTVKYEGNTHLMRFCAMVYRNPKFMVWLSRREKADPGFAKISSWQTGRAGNDLMKRIAQTGQGPGGGNRYEAVNTLPAQTNEVRLFRGTLNFKSFCSSIELCHALWAYSAVPTNPVCDCDNETAIMGFVKWVNKSLWYDAAGKKCRVYPHLSELFKAREEELKKVLDNKTNVFSSDEWVAPKKKGKLAKEAV